MARLFSPVRLLALGLVLLAVVAVLRFTPSDEYIFLPDRAHAVAPFVTVQGERQDEDGGGIYYVAVDVRKATLLEKLIPGLRDGATLVPASQVRPPGVSEQRRRRGELRAMAHSQEIAAAVALKALGRRVAIRSRGTPIAAVLPDGPADGKLEPNDIVTAVDGVPANFPADLRRLIRKHRPGEPVRLTVRRGDHLEQIEVRTGADPRDERRAMIGVLSDCSLTQSAEIDLPLAVRIDIGEVGGPSAGLAFALDIAEELGRDIDRGYRVAATGELCLDGTVGEVGGIKQKTIGAKRAGVEVLLVPAGENAAEAKRYAGNIRVIPVNSFRQALHALATLPRKTDQT